MDRIIDAHCHLGDVLYPNGANLIEKKGVKNKFILDIISLSELTLHKYAYESDVHSGMINKLDIRSGIARSSSATLENSKKSMDKAGICTSVCMPIHPNVTFDDLKSVAQKEPRIIPFTSVDFSREHFGSCLSSDVAAGAKGLKLHPILQCLQLTSKKTFDVVEAFAPYELPILMHTGIAHYYFKEEDKLKQMPSYGEIHYVRDLVKAFPKVKFIAGHAGLAEVRDVLEMLGGFKNVWVDISFQNVENVRKLIDVFGPEKVLFASDWPFCSRITPVRVTKRACRGDRGIEHQIFWQNAAELMGLSV